MTEELIRYVMSFIGGGFAVAVVNWLHSSSAARKQGELAQLREQLKCLYGPISYFTRSNEALFVLNEKIHDAYGSEFIAKDWSDDPLTRERVKEGATTTIDLANSYVNQAVENNKRILALLESNWHLVDQEDLPEFIQFRVDCTRMATEMYGKMRLKTPDAVYQALGEISYMRPALIGRVAEKVAAKQDRIDQLLLPRWRRSKRRGA